MARTPNEHTALISRPSRRERVLEDFKRVLASFRKAMLTFLAASGPITVIEIIFAYLTWTKMNSTPLNEAFINPELSLLFSDPNRCKGVLLKANSTYPSVLSALQAIPIHPAKTLIPVTIGSLGLGKTIVSLFKFIYPNDTKLSEKQARRLKRLTNILPATINSPLFLASFLFLYFPHLIGDPTDAEEICAQLQDPSIDLRVFSFFGLPNHYLEDITQIMVYLLFTTILATINTSTFFDPSDRRKSNGIVVLAEDLEQGAGAEESEEPNTANTNTSIGLS